MKAQKSRRPNFVAELTDAENRALTLAEAVNRYLMKVEGGTIDPSTQGSRIVGDIASYYNTGESAVNQIIHHQVTKRVRAAHTRIERVRGAITGEFNVN